MSENTQRYDNSLKTLLQGQAEEVFRALALDVFVDQELCEEALKPPLRADRVYRVRLYNEPAILHTELESGADGEMLKRMLEYCGILYRKHRLPVISVVIYPFRTTLPSTPLKVTVGPETLLTFHCRLIALWELRARDFIDKRAVPVYALLPTMDGATYALLKQALDEMKAWYGEQHRRFGEQLLLFDVFLQRSDTVSEKDKKGITEVLNMFDHLLEESRFVKRAEAKGSIETLREIGLKMVQQRAPDLVSMTQQKLSSIQDKQELEALVMGMVFAVDEESLRKVLAAVSFQAGE